MKGLTVKDVTPETLAVMSKLSFDRQKAKPLVQPIYHTSTYKVDDVNEYLDILAKVRCNIVSKCSKILFVYLAKELSEFELCHEKIPKISSQKGNAYSIGHVHYFGHAQCDAF